MKRFMDKRFMLNSEVAQTLYDCYVEELPIIDYHCHINPKDIAINRKFENITQLWLEGDHYKWRQMRSNGIDEKYITGNASDWEKFEKWASVLEKAIGNPLYHWSHLELKYYFNYDGILNKKNAKTVWEFCNKKLKGDNLKVKRIISKSNVEILCTTDDPIDDLKWHRIIKNDGNFKTLVLPTWRPDCVLAIEDVKFKDYISKLEEVSKVKINTFSDLKKSLKYRLNYFKKLGCKIADHSLSYIMYKPASDEEIENIFNKRIQDIDISEEEILKFKTACMLFFAKEYYDLDWAMQLHFGVKRENNSKLFEIAGANSGCDCIQKVSLNELVEYMDALNSIGKLPRTILYSLNPLDNAIIGTIIGCFQGDGIPGKIQQGAAWWFNDHKRGIEDQMKSLGELGLLGNFIGMLTDSRSFVSYVRHDYFRRIMCNLIGEWVNSGEYPYEIETLGNLVRDISYNNCKRYFKFDNKDLVGGSYELGNGMVEL